MNKTLFIQIFVILAIVGSYIFVDFDKVYKLIKDEPAFVAQEKFCDLHKTPCSIIIDKKMYTLEVFPKDIPLMKELTFVLTTSDKISDKINLNVYATNMFMGYFDFKFEKISENMFQSKGTLPTCPVGNMQWNADLSLSKDTGARFMFQTTR